MHVVHIIPTLSFGGAERIVVDIINESRPEFTFSVIVFSNDTPLQKQITRKNVQVICVPKRGQVSLHLFGDLKKMLRKLQPDIVHTHLFGADLWGRVAARSLGIPVISTEHNMNANEGKLKTLIKRWSQDSDDTLVACSAAVRTNMVHSYGVKQKIAVIRPGIPVSKFSSLPISNFSSPLQLLMLGRLTEQKGHAVALEALSHIDFPWELSIVGNGPLEASLKQRAKDLHCSEKVKFFSATSEVKSVYAKHDMVLMPSKWEGLSLVAMEALAAGRALIVTDVGGMREIIQDGKTGFLTTPKVSDFEKKLLWCFSHLEEVKKVAEKGREYAEENCSVEKMVLEYEKVYKKMNKN